MTEPAATPIIDLEFSKLIPPLAPEELAGLEASIVADGCRDALIVWQGILLDGHNRLAICQRHGLTFQIVPAPAWVQTRDDALEFAIRNQLGRRNLPPFVTIELIERLKPLIAAKAKAQQGARTDLLPTLAKSPTDTREELSKLAGVSHGTLAKAEVVIEHGTDEEKQQLRQKKVSISEAHKRVRRRLEKAEREAKADASKASTDSSLRERLESVCDLRVCSCADLLASATGIDAVITDPPYPREFLPAFSELAEACFRAKVPLVAVMSGQTYLPEVLTRLCEYLAYRWTMAYLTPGGQSVQSWPSKINTFWKPVLLFGAADAWIGDVAKSAVNDNDKRFHEWGQSESGMMELISRLTKPGQLVCDPFLGAGTTAIACVASGRRFVGGDVDAACVGAARLRLEAVLCQM